MKIETRVFRRRRVLVLICETEEESVMLDSVVGCGVEDDGHIATVTGEVKLESGHGEHYIRLEKLRL